MAKLYRIPVKPHGPKALTKARIAYQLRPAEGVIGGHDVVAEPGALVITVHASSHAEAGRVLQAVYLSGDSRPIMGRCMVGHFLVRTPAEG